MNLIKVIYANFVNRYKDDSKCTFYERIKLVKVLNFLKEASLVFIKYLDKIIKKKKKISVRM